MAKLLSLAMTMISLVGVVTVRAADVAGRDVRPADEAFLRGFPFVDVFSTGERYGYRIPALVTTTKGTLLAFGERRIGLNDHAQNDIVLKRSFDGGKTWGTEQVIADMGGDSLNDPCAVIDGNTGRILLLFIRFPQGYHARKSGHTEMAELGYGGPRNTQSFLTWSDDDGATWADLIDITRSLRRKDAISIGSPGRGIQLSRGKHKGRLLLPIYETIPSGNNQRYWRNCAAISDDGGKSWRLGRRVPREDVKGHGNEAQLVELADGSVMINCRSQGGPLCRQVSVSRDGGETWQSMREEPGLPTVPCMGSVLRCSWPEDGKSRILAAIPSPQGRKHGKVYVSFDEGKTWPVSKTLYPGGYAYSCLAVLPDGDIGCLFERDGYKTITLARFSLEWLTNATDRLGE